MKAVYYTLLLLFLGSTTFAQSLVCPTALTIKNSDPGTLPTPISDVSYFIESIEAGQTTGPITPAPMSNGCIDLDALPPVTAGGIYRVYPRKDEQQIAGVSTLDMVYVMRHIIGLTQLSPYQMLSSDVDGNFIISVIDIGIIQEVILAIKDNFPIPSWQFVDKSVDPFIDPTSIFKDFIEIDPDSPPAIIEFWGVKTADITGTKIPFASGDGDLVFKVEDRILEENEIITVDFLARDFKDFLGYQFSLDFDESVLRFQEHEIVNLPDGALNGWNFNVTHNGIIPNLWVDLNGGVDIEDDAVLFSITFKVLQKGLLSNVLKAGSDITQNLVFKNVTDEPSMVVLDYSFATGLEEDATKTAFILSQNQPNPVEEFTIIPLHFENPGLFKLNITDALGRTIKSIEAQGVAGQQSIELQRADFGAAGLYYYTLQTESFSESKHLMVK